MSNAAEIKPTFKFKVGDWIIATKPTFKEPSFGFGMMSINRTFVPDRSHMDRPIKVNHVAEQHIVYEFVGFITGKKVEKIISKYELEERGFIIADDTLVNTSLKE